MTEPTYQTRAEADPRSQLAGIMAPGFYEAEKATGSSLPAWDRVEPTYRAQIERGLAGALIAAERAGWRIVRP